MTLAPPYPPTNELVGIAWLVQVAGLPAGNVATTLPKDPASWADNYFVTVTALPGGTPDVDGLGRYPVLQLDSWAAVPGSNKPSWRRANVPLELVRLATEDAQRPYYGKPLLLPTDYRGARLLAGYLVTEPTRVPDDPSGYARFTADLALNWAMLPAA